MDQPTADDLLRVPLLARLSHEIRTALAQRFEVEQFGAGRKVVTEGVAGYAFYVIDRGTLQVTSGGVDLRTLGPGEFFGEISILGDGRRTATVTALETVIVWALFGTVFRVLQMNRPDVAEALEAAMRERLSAG
jgi:CRP-like cAMP-binding protein